MDPSSPRALSLSLVLLLLCCTVVAGFVLPWAQSLVQSSNPTAPFLHPSSPRAAGVRVAMSATDSAEGRPLVTRCCYLLFRKFPGCCRTVACLI